MSLPIEKGRDLEREVNALVQRVRSHQHERFYGTVELVFEAGSITKLYTRRPDRLLPPDPSRGRPA